jgi:hypothetical protein
MLPDSQRDRPRREHFDDRSSGIQCLWRRRESDEEGVAVRRAEPVPYFCLRRSPLNPPGLHLHCLLDANPEAGEGLDLARAHGEAIRDGDDWIAM